MTEKATGYSNGTLTGAAVTEQSTYSSTETLDLDRLECLRLFPGTAVGRIAVSITEWDHPVIRPVNYLFDTHS